MAITYELIVEEDLELGTGAVTRTNPGGGTMQGTQINLSTFALAASAQWGPTVPAGGTATTDVAVPGAVAGNLALISHDKILTSLLVAWAEVTLNSVRVVLYNPTGAPIVVPAGTLRVLVFQVP